MPQIFATAGPACSDRETLKNMFLCGMTGVRLNLSHTSLRDAAGMIETLKNAAADAGVEDFRFMVDMQGPELRIGVPALNELCGGETVTLGSSELPVPAICLPFLKEGQRVLIDDGKLELCVCGEADGLPLAEVTRGGKLLKGKSIALPGCSIHPPAMTEKDRKNIADFAAFGVTDLMQPFVRSADDLAEVRAELKRCGAENVRIMAKIENLEGFSRLGELVDAADEICIARGDLGNAVPLWQLPALQKEIARVCREKGKKFTVATQMLASMENSAVPTRAEVCDIFNAVLDGGDLMVTGETAAGKYPVEVIKFLANTAKEAEKYLKNE